MIVSPLRFRIRDSNPLSNHKLKANDDELLSPEATLSFIRLMNSLRTALFTQKFLLDSMNSITLFLRLPGGTV